MIEVDLYAHGNDWLTPKGKVDIEAIRAKHRAKYYAERKSVRNPVRPETLAKLERVMARATVIDTAQLILDLE